MHENTARPPATAGSQPTDPLAEPVRAHLAAGRWRKARDEAKLLCKRDRSRYLPLLIEANVCLARDMFARGLSSEAEQVLTYLKTIAPASALTGIEDDLACARGDPKALRDRALRLLANPGESRTEAERIRLADEAVLAFAPPVSVEGSGSSALVAELTAVHQALESVCERRYEEALERIRPLPRDSVFGHWMLFVKGMVAFHRGDRARAERCFAGLPAGSAPTKACAGYRLLLADSGSRRGVPKEAELQVACCVIGRRNLAEPLLKAETHWRKERHAEAYDCLRRAVPDFPRASADPIGVLSEFFFNSLHSLSTARSDRLQSLFDRLGFRRKARSDGEMALALRAMCLSLSNVLEADLIDGKWREFLALLDKLHGRNPRRRSLGYSWLGEQLASEEPNGFGPFHFLSRGSGMRDGRRAVAALAEAAESDPTNLEAHLKLCEVYQKLGKTSERNRFLDEMTRRFADRKEVLLLAGMGCLERNALKKGTDYLERALTLDRLDPAIPEAVVIGRIKRAVEQYRDHKLDQARQTWASLEEFILESPNNLNRSRWALLARQGVLENLFGDPSVGESRLDRARAVSPSIEAFLFHLHLAQRVYAPNQQGRWLEEFSAHGRTGARIGHAPLLILILEYWKRLLGDKCRHEEAELRQYLRQASRRPFTRDEVAALLMSAPPSLDLESEFEPIVKRQLEKDPDDPVFRLHDLMRDPDTNDPARAKTVSRELQSIIEEAHRRGDDRTARMAQSAQNEINRRRAHLPGSEFDIDAWAEDDADEDEDIEDLESAIFDPSDAPPPFEGMEEWAQLVEMVADASPGQIKELKRNPPPGMPREIFDLLIRTARDGGMPPPPPRSPLPNPRAAAPRPPRPPPHRPDPSDQPELPF